MPLLVERKIPSGQVPAKRFVPEMAREKMYVSVKPESTALQLVPLLVERNTPPPAVPANRFVPDALRAHTSVYVKPVLTALQLVPLLVERKTPSSVPAKTFVPQTARQ